MKSIPLTQGLYTVVDDEDYAVVAQYKWYAQRCKKSFYARRRVGKKKISLHQFLMPGVIQIDHRDGDGLNNRRRNLRPATSHQNQCNQPRRKDNTSGFKGVFWDKNKSKWRARIWFRGLNQSLGYFEDPTVAAKAYDEAARRFHGEFARCNFS